MFIRDEYGNLTFVPASLCSAEGEGEGEGSAEGAGGSEGEKAGEEGAKSGSGEEGAKEGAGGDQEGEGAKAAADDTNWYDGIQSDDAKKFAGRSPDLEHFVGRTMELQKQASDAIVKPGKDAKPEEVTAYHKRIGMPETAEGYKFAMPEGHEATEADKAFQSAMGKAFHAAEVSTEHAALLTEAFNVYAQETIAAQVASDKKFADDAEADLHRLWPGDAYATNIAHQERAAVWMFGDQLEEMRHLETKDGRFVNDHPVIVRAMAAVGREMAEGGLVPPMSASATERVADDLSDIQKRIDTAQGKGDSVEANRLYAQKLSLLKKTGGNQPIVGAAGRAA